MYVIGVLAIQGDFEAHSRVLSRLGAEARGLGVPADRKGLDGSGLPGGGRRTMRLGIEREGLAEPLRGRVAAGAPVLGTCAGLIVLDRAHLGLLDLIAERNAFGRQVRSFEADLELGELGGEVRAVFIRAPWVAEHGEGVEVLAEIDGHPVAVRQDEILAVAFHPEIDGDTRLHEWLLERVEARNGGQRQ